MKRSEILKPRVFRFNDPKMIEVIYQDHIEIFKFSSSARIEGSIINEVEMAQGNGGREIHYTTEEDILNDIRQKY